ncbi:MAG: hypothetical protein RLZZ290_1157 [Pseudomonadota bacterium]
MKNPRVVTLGIMIVVGVMLQGCAVVAVADAAVTATATVVGVGVKATGAVVEAMIPSGSDEEKQKKK